MAKTFEKAVEVARLPISSHSRIQVQLGFFKIGLFTCILCMPILAGFWQPSVSIVEKFQRPPLSLQTHLSKKALVVKAVSSTEKTQLVKKAASPILLTSILPDWKEQALTWFLFLLVGIRLLLLAYKIGKTRIWALQGDLIRKVGRTEIRVSSHWVTPFAFSGIRQNVIGLPTRILLQSKQQQISIQHEMAHLRFNDPMLSYLFRTIHCFVLFPYHFKKWLSQFELLQEMRVDEFLINSNKIAKSEYGACLYDMALNAQSMKTYQVGATGMAFHLSHHQLSRRIVNMKCFKKNISRKALWSLFFVSSLSLSTFAASSSLGLASEDVDKEKIDKSRFTAGFPIDLNPQVLHQLTRYTKTEKGRRHSIKAFANYETQKQVIDDLFRIMDMPKELKAIAFVESAFQNLGEGKNPTRSAGIWQFIPSTARHYHMEVNERNDDRADVAIQTVAAITYLRKLHRQFGDWRLALLAYNMGERALEKGMKKEGTNDPWQLISLGVEGDSHYLPKVEAAMILMAHPELLN